MTSLRHSRPKNKNYPIDFCSIFNYSKAMIQYDIPIPPMRVFADAAISTQTLQAMPVGSSTYITGTPKALATARTLISRFGKRTGRKYVTRTDGDGIRIWRTE